MKFLALVIALILLRLWGSGERVQYDDWFCRWQSRVASWQLPQVLATALALLVPALVVALLLEAVEDGVFGLAWIALATLLLLYSLGRGNLQVLQARYHEQCLAGDFQGALHGTLPVLGARPGDDPQSPEDVHAEVLRAFYYYGYQRWFAVLFWFVLTGPVGALVYRLLQLHAATVDAPLPGKLLSLADWIPSRLLAATFALAGDFVGSRNALAGAWREPGQGADSLLCEVGCAAGLPQVDPASPFNELALAQHEECGALLARSASVWLAVVAALVLMA